MRLPDHRLEKGSVQPARCADDCGGEGDFGAIGRRLTGRRAARDRREIEYLSTQPLRRGTSNDLSISVLPLLSGTRTTQRGMKWLRRRNRGPGVRRAGTARGHATPRRSCIGWARERWRWAWAPRWPARRGWRWPKPVARMVRARRVRRHRVRGTARRRRRAATLGSIPRRRWPPPRRPPRHRLRLGRGRIPRPRPRRRPRKCQPRR